MNELIKNDENNYAIKWVFTNKYYKVVKLLLKDERVDPNNNNNNFAIIKSFDNEYYKIVKLLLKDKRIDKNNQIVKNIINKMKNIKY